MTSVTLKGLTKYYTESMPALQDVDLHVEEGEFVTLLGPSGCGKSTMLRIIAGLLDPSAGQVLFGDTVVNHLPPHKRNVGLVFQNYALFPHRTVFENVAFGLRMRKVKSSAIKERVQKALEMVQLGEFGSRYPSQLSGGQQQRVSLARALVYEPSVLLLDEPFGALDKKLREAMQLELRELQRTLKVTTIFVTHDQEEALTLSDRIAVMNAGRIEQVDEPSILYEQPRTPFALSFVGSSNSWTGTVLEANGESVRLETSEGLDLRSRNVSARGGFRPGETILAACRPEKMWISSVEPKPSINACCGVISNIVYLGSMTHYYIESASGTALVNYELNEASERGGSAYGVGQRVYVCWRPEDTLVFHG